MNRMLLLGFALCLAAVGCGGLNFPGSTSWPYGMSADKHNFVSTHNMPLNIELRDSVTDETLLMIHVPAGEMVVMNFKREQKGTASASGAMPANRVRWEIMPPDKSFDTKLENTRELAGREVVLRVHVRDDSALPDGVDPRTGLLSDDARADTPPDDARQSAEPAEPVDRGGDDSAETNQATPAGNAEADGDASVGSSESERTADGDADADAGTADADAGSEAASSSGQPPLLEPAPPADGSDQAGEGGGQPATLDQPDGMTPPLEAESDESTADHVLDSQPNAPPPIRAPRLENDG